MIDIKESISLVTQLTHSWRLIPYSYRVTVYTPSRASVVDLSHYDSETIKKKMPIRKARPTLY